MLGTLNVLSLLIEQPKGISICFSNFFKRETEALGG